MDDAAFERRLAEDLTRLADRAAPAGPSTGELQRALRVRQQQRRRERRLAWLAGGFAAAAAAVLALVALKPGLSPP